MRFFPSLRSDPHRRRAAIPGLRPALLIAAIAVCLALLASCGGGGGTPVVGGGVIPSAYTEGTINGFGSVIVNGIRFDETAASVTDDAGVQRTASALKLGMCVEVDSGQVVDGTARATALRFGSRALGPVDAIDTAAKTVTLLGQVVDIGDATVWGDGLSAGIATLTVGAVIEVNGLPDAATGHLVATRIDSAAGATAYKLRGVVAGLDTVSRTLRIGSATISYAGVASVPTTLAEGQTLRVTLATTPVAGVWTALTLGTARHQPADATAVQLRGGITAFASASAFSVNGQPVDASGAAFPDGSTGLALGMQVEVKGTVRNGVLVATQVELESRHKGDADRRFELHGLITAVDAAAQTFVVRGVTVSYAGSVSYTGGTAANLVVGTRVEVRGGAGSSRTQVVATAIAFES